jgi:hypothetical protein
MIAKDRIFKKGDVIVSGFGNVRILVGETGRGKAGDGAEGVFYDAVPPYCTSDAPAGTDMRYARHATKREKKRFFQVLEANGLKYDAKTCTVKAGEEYTPEDTENYTVNRYNGEPMPFKVVKKRIRPTLSQIRLLEEEVKLRDEIINTHCKEKVELKDHLDEVKGCNEKMAKDLAILQEDNDKLKAKNTTLEQSNKLMESELALQKGRVSELAQSDKEGKEYIDYLLNRNILARLLNKK